MTEDAKPFPHDILEADDSNVKISIELLTKSGNECYAFWRQALTFLQHSIGLLNWSFSRDGWINCTLTWIIS